jgi:hypothetical protein
MLNPATMFHIPSQFFALVQGKVCRVLLLAVMLCAAASCNADSHPSSASHLLPPSVLRCANQEEPLAVADTQPEFSWHLGTSSPMLHAVSQTAYRIQVSAADAGLASGHGILWDSGVVQSASVSGIAYAGSPLEAEHAYAWRVRVWDEQGRPSGWSGIAHWVQAPVWHARWIAAHTVESEEAGDPLPLFRRSFSFSRPIVRAVLYASGMGQDELRVNGRKVGGRKVGNDELAPGWSDYRKTVYYDSYDVASLLRKGQNTIGILLGNGMYRVLRTPGRQSAPCNCASNLQAARSPRLIATARGRRILVQSPSHLPMAVRTSMLGASLEAGTGQDSTTQASTTPIGALRLWSTVPAEHCGRSRRLRFESCAPTCRSKQVNPSPAFWSTIWARILPAGRRSP